VFSEWSGDVFNKDPIAGLLGNMGVRRFDIQTPWKLIASEVQPWRLFPYGIVLRQWKFLTSPPNHISFDLAKRIDFTHSIRFQSCSISLLLNAKTEILGNPTIFIPRFIFSRSMKRDIQL
jgi:hypothetical protein